MATTSLRKSVTSGGACRGQVRSGRRGVRRPWRLCSGLDRGRLFYDQAFVSRSYIYNPNGESLSQAAQRNRTAARTDEGDYF